MTELECNSDEVIVIADQTSLIESLAKNLAILRAEARHCVLIDAELETNLQCFRDMSNGLSVKLQSLRSLATRAPTPETRRTIAEFAEKIKRSWDHINQQVQEEYTTFFVASRTVYGVALTSLLAEVKKELATVKTSLKLGEQIYEREYVVKGYMYCSELTKLLNTLDGCDEKVQQYLMMSKILGHLHELDSTIDRFASRTNFLAPAANFLDPMTALLRLLSGELFGWQPVSPHAILKDNTPKKPVFITKTSRRTQLRSLQHLPLFH